MRNHVFAITLATLFSASCVGSSTSSSMMMGTTAPTPVATSGVSGTWIGTASDSTGTMMGAGMSPSMMGNMTWEITQTGNTFTGVMRFPGYAGVGTMTVSGTINGKTVTFTMTMPGGSMMTATCTATATGSVDLDDLMTQMHGSYSGSNSCSGPFSHGQMTMMRR